MLCSGQFFGGYIGYTVLCLQAHFIYFKSRSLRRACSALHSFVVQTAPQPPLHWLCSPGSGMAVRTTHPTASRHHTQGRAVRAPPGGADDITTTAPAHSCLATVLTLLLTESQRSKHVSSDMLLRILLAVGRRR